MTRRASIVFKIATLGIIAMLQRADAAVPDLSGSLAALAGDGDDCVLCLCAQPAGGVADGRRTVGLHRPPTRDVAGLGAHRNVAAGVHHGGFRRRTDRGAHHPGTCDRHRVRHHRRCDAGPEPRTWIADEQPDAGDRDSSRSAAVRRTRELCADADATGLLLLLAATLLQAFCCGGCRKRRAASRRLGITAADRGCARTGAAGADPGLARQHRRLGVGRILSVADAVAAARDHRIEFASARRTCRHGSDLERRGVDAGWRANGRARPS